MFAIKPKSKSKSKPKMTCTICGSKILKTSYKKHSSSKKHIKALNALKQKQKQKIVSDHPLMKSIPDEAFWDWRTPYLEAPTCMCITKWGKGSRCTKKRVKGSKFCHIHKKKCKKLNPKRTNYKNKLINQF